MGDRGEEPPPEVYQGCIGALRISGIILPLCCLALFIIGTSFESAYNGLICILPTATFLLELTAFLLIYWMLVPFDDKMRKSDTIVHLALGVINSIIGPIYLIIFIVRESKHKDFDFSTFLLLVADGLLIAQGVIYLVLAYNCWQRFKTYVPKKEIATSAVEMDSDEFIVIEEPAPGGDAPKLKPSKLQV